MKKIVWLALLVAACNHDNEVTRTNIVTNSTDPDLINAWGLAFNPQGVAWVSANGTGLAIVYDVNGNHVIPPITIPPPSGAAPSSQTTATPTGQVFNGDPTAFMGDAFIFATEDGTISGWQASDDTTAMLRIDNSAATAVYKGIAIGQATNGSTRLYASNFHNGTVDVYDVNYRPISSTGGFVDPQLPAGFAPFNVAVIQGDVLVSYALQDADKMDDVAGLGNGFVDLYDGDGDLLGRLLSGNELNSPWGMTTSPSTFDAAPNRLIIGNFGDGFIHTYTLSIGGQSANLDGTLEDSNGNDMSIDGLWALQFGPDAGNFDPNSLYFTAGPNMESNGVFGRLQSRN